MSDWLDNASPEERSWWDDFVHNVRVDALRKIEQSAFVISAFEGDVDVKYAVELGLAIMLDKPIVVVAPPGVKLPERLRRVADEVLQVDIDTQAGQAAVKRTIRRLLTLP